MTTKYTSARRLADATLKRINDQMYIGATSMADMARTYGVSRSALAHQLSVARTKGKLPKAKRGRPKTIRRYVDESLINLPRDNTFNPSDIGEL